MLRKLLLSNADVHSHCLLHQTAYHYRLPLLNECKPKGAVGDGSKVGTAASARYAYKIIRLLLKECVQWLVPWYWIFQML